jgi:23S rRNA (uracil1939-C5)-methyltransferase
MKKELTELRIVAIDSRGRGRGTTTVGDGTQRPVVVTGAYPGDLVDLRLRRRKAKTYLGEITAISEAGVPRREPFCRHFADCGGCTIQDLAYADQLTAKHAMVAAAFREAGFGVVPSAPATVGGAFTGEATRDASSTGGSPALPSLPELPAVLPAPRERHYRNKLEFSFGAQRWLSTEEIAHAEEIADRRGLGFHVAGRFDRVLDLDECHLQPEPSESIRRFLREYAREHDLTFYEAREHHGLLRLLTIRTALSGETMVILMFGEDQPAAIERIMTDLAAAFPEITSLNYVINTSRNDSLFPQDVRGWRGDPWITEHSGPNRLRIRPKAFYQTNPEQAVHLYQRAVEMADLPRDARVFDLYSGIGSIALFIARSVASVVGVESIPDAVTAARENAELNGIDNAIFEEGEVEAILPAVAERDGVPDAVVVDPPRVGLHPKALAALRDLAPATVVYISCNPRTQATDIAGLADLYRVEALQPVDMFPQTRHVENIAILRRTDSVDTSPRQT